MRRTLRVGNYNFALPSWAPARILIGVLFICMGFLGFLPVLGFWMLPLGLAVLSYDIPIIRLARQKIVLWWKYKKASK